MREPRTRAPTLFAKRQFLLLPRQNLTVHCRNTVGPKTQPPQLSRNDPSGRVRVGYLSDHSQFTATAFPTGQHVAGSFFVRFMFDEHGETVCVSNRELTGRQVRRVCSSRESRGVGYTSECQRSLHFFLNNSSPHGKRICGFSVRRNFTFKQLCRCENRRACGRRRLRPRAETRPRP